MALGIEMDQLPHQPELDEVLRKIGRNVLHFQRMEAMLKFLISRSSLEGTASELRSNHEKAVEAVSRQTMGNLVKGLFASVYSEQKKAPTNTDEIEETWLSFSFNIEADPVYLEQRRAALDQVVEERNMLIHQMLVTFDQTSLESCRELSVLLDEQAQKVRPEYEALRSLVLAVQAGRREIVSLKQ